MKQTARIVYTTVYTTGFSAASMALILLTPQVAFAAPETFEGLVRLVVDIINIIIPVLIAAAVAIFFWNTASVIFDASKGQSNTDKRTAIIWGIAILFVMVSIWGILNLLANTFLTA